MPVQYVLQKSSDPSIFYKEKKGQWKAGSGTPAVLVEVNDVEKATKYNSIAQISKMLERVFQNTIKGHLTDMSDGFKIIKCATKIVYTEEKALDSTTQQILDDLQKSSIMIKETHYSTIELFNKIRRNPELAGYKYIISTPYNSMTTSKLNDLFESHGLEPIKSKGNFAFNREDYWTAAKLICDVPYKSFNL